MFLDLFLVILICGFMCAFYYAILLILVSENTKSYEKKFKLCFLRMQYFAVATFFRENGYSV